MNWNKLTYREKNKVMGIAFIVFFVVVYQFAISKSWDLYKQNNQLEEKLVAAESYVKSKDELDKRSSKLDFHISSFFIDSLNHQEHLLETISSYCHQQRILIKEIPAMTEYKEGGFEIGTYRIVLEGDFIPLLKMVYQLEQKSKLGRISSVAFSLKYDNKRKKDVLSLVLYIQNIQLYSDEEKS